MYTTRQSRNPKKSPPPFPPPSRGRVRVGGMLFACQNFKKLNVSSTEVTEDYFPRPDFSWFSLLAPSLDESPSSSFQKGAAGFESA